MENARQSLRLASHDRGAAERRCYSVGTTVKRIAFDCIQLVSETGILVDDGTKLPLVLDESKDKDLPRTQTPSADVAQTNKFIL